MLKCNVVMTKDPECCLPTDPVSTPAKLMRDLNVGAIPVIENKNTKRLIGIITDRDLAVLVVANAYDPETTKVAEIMTSQVMSCHVEDDFQKALDAMAAYQVRRIPVVDDENKIVGIISQADVATRVDQPEETGRVVKDISEPHIESDPYVNQGHQDEPATG